jgi:hypothetical protein
MPYTNNASAIAEARPASAAIQAGFRNTPSISNTAEIPTLPNKGV